MGRRRALRSRCAALSGFTPAPVHTPKQFQHAAGAEFEGKPDDQCKALPFVYIQYFFFRPGAPRRSRPPELYITRHGYTRRTTSTSTQRTPSYKTQCIAQPFLALTPHVSHRPRKPSFRRYLQSIQTDFPATTMPLLLPQDAIQHGRLWREHSIQRVWARSRCPCDAHAMPAITS